MIILVDMDGVVADFEEGHRRMCRNLGFGAILEGAERTTWDILDTVDPAHKAAILDIWHSPGFFRGLKPIAGANEVMHSWLRGGHEVFLCTAPMLNHATCAQEKIAWVADHLGPEFAGRVIITRDKTLVHGDVLIDDRPDIVGVNKKPSWKHWLYATSYNANHTHTHRYRGNFGPGVDGHWTWVFT